MVVDDGSATENGKPDSDRLRDYAWERWPTEVWVECRQQAIPASLFHRSADSLEEERESVRNSVDTSREIWFAPHIHEE